MKYFFDCRVMIAVLSLYIGSASAQVERKRYAYTTDKYKCFLSLDDHGDHFGLKAILRFGKSYGDGGHMTRIAKSMLPLTPEKVATAKFVKVKVDEVRTYIIMRPADEIAAGDDIQGGRYVEYIPDQEKEGWGTLRIYRRGPVIVLGKPSMRSRTVETRAIIGLKANLSDFSGYRMFSAPEADLDKDPYGFDLLGPGYMYHHNVRCDYIQGLDPDKLDR